MPNHVHVIVRPLLCDVEPLERILQSWKRHTALKINRLLAQSGTLWQDESFDRIIRDEEHLYRVLQYIGANPSKAGLTTAQCPTWIRPAWIELGWRFEDPVGRISNPSGQGRENADVVESKADGLKIRPTEA
jgi:hypothetical protein